MDNKVERVMLSLQKNNIKPYYVETKEEVVPLVNYLLNEGDTVSAGGSVSLSETGIIEHLKCGRYNFLNRNVPGLTDEDIRNIYISALNSDAYFCSCNAVTENGELYNVDGNANRICAISFGPKSVIMIVGVNKIVCDMNEAIKRVKTIAAPKICKHRGNHTYCRKIGHCISIDKGQIDMASGCDSPERVCCSYLITGQQRVKDRIKIILVNDNLGF
ncbi:MAG: lactate utilization protein [Bacillota bacterium]|nr:lactate utilization protein [Bacillota bacterium]